MKILILFSLLSLLLGATPVFAFVVCHNYQDFAEVKMNGKVGTEEFYKTNEVSECINGKPLVVYVTSKGGYIDKIDEFLRDFRPLMIEAKEKSGVTPVVVVKDECSSACIPILSGLNRMMRERTVHLIVDRKAYIGFHGCSDEVKVKKETQGVTTTEIHLVFTEAGTQRYLQYLEDYGGSREWIERHANLFKTSDVKYFKPDDSEITQSQIISDAQIIDLDLFPNYLYSPAGS